MIFHARSSGESLRPARISSVSLLDSALRVRSAVSFLIPSCFARHPSRPTPSAPESRSAARGSVFWLPDHPMLHAFPAADAASGSRFGSDLRLMILLLKSPYEQCRSSSVTATGSRRIYTGFPQVVQARFRVSFPFHFFSSCRFSSRFPISCRISDLGIRAGMELKSNPSVQVPRL